MISKIKMHHRNMRALHIRGCRKGWRIARKIKRFFISDKDKAPGDNFPKGPLLID